LSRGRYPFHGQLRDGQAGDPQFIYVAVAEPGSSESELTDRQLAYGHSAHRRGSHRQCRHRCRSRHDGAITSYRHIPPTGGRKWMPRLCRVI
jgi:hypothetical protein